MRITLVYDLLLYVNFDSLDVLLSLIYFKIYKGRLIQVDWKIFEQQQKTCLQPKFSNTM